MVGLGVDFGGVIVEQSTGSSNSSMFEGNHLAMIPTLGVYDALATLAQTTFGDNIYVISKCSLRNQQKTYDWLKYHCFTDRTGIPLNRILFCRDRSGKAPIAAALALTHFVDDRADVLATLTTVSNRFLFQSSRTGDGEEVGPLQRDLIAVTGWRMVVSHVLAR